MRGATGNAAGQRFAPPRRQAESTSRPEHGDVRPDRATSRPEHASGQPPRAARGPGGQRAPGSHLLYLVVLAVSSAGLWWMWYGGPHRVQGGTLAVAGALFVAALARLVLPEGWAGMLASRGRLTDVVALAVLAAGLLAVGLVLPTPS